MRKHLSAMVLVLSSLACSFLTRSLTPPTAIPTTVTGPISTPTYTISLIEEDVYCPSDIPGATDVYNQGLTEEQAGNYERAIELYKNAIELDPEYCDAMDNLGLNLKRLGRTEESIDWYLRSIEVFPENDVAYLGLGNAYRQLGRYDEAISTFKQLSLMAPENPEGYFGLGMAYYDIGQYQDSIDSLKEAERLYNAQNSSYIADAQIFIGYNYFSLQDMENAVNYFELAYPAYQGDAELNYYLGFSYYDESPVQDFVKAKQYLLKARDLGYSLEPELEKFINQP